MRISRGYAGGGMSGGTGTGEGAEGIFSFMSTLPPWLSTIITIGALILLAWVVGVIVGKLYASIKYPDPNKPSVFSAKQKVIFLGVAVAVVVLLYTTLTKTEDPSGGMLPSDGGPAIGGDSIGGGGPIKGGGMVIVG